MGTPGKTVLLESGKRGLLGSGKGAVFNSDGECEACCGGASPPCESHTIDSRSVMGGPFGGTLWDISAYRNNPVFTPNSRWRLVLHIPSLSLYCIVAAEGDVDESGFAIGLPRSINTYYGVGYSDSYELQNGCLPNDFTHQHCEDREYECPDQYIVLEY